MSADNGIYILVSRGRKIRRNGKVSYRKQYRVIHAQAIENITYAPDYPSSTLTQESELNRKYVLDYFGEARVHTDRRVAEGYAQAIFDDIEKGGFSYLEYGIVWFDEYADIPFPRKEQSQQRPPQRRNRRRRLASVS